MAETNYNFEWMKNFVSDFQKALQCPVCLDVVKKPFKQCARGHLVCVSCLRNIPSCPTCKGNLLLMNPVCIQNLLEYLPRNCCYSTDGCMEMFQDGNDHEKFCGFRRIKCRYNCFQNILAKEFSGHLNTVHHDNVVMKTESVEGVRWKEFKSSNGGNLYIFLFQRVFCISLDNNNDDELLKITFKSYPIGQVNGDYYAKVSFSNGNFGYSYTLKAFPVEKDEYDAEINRAEYCMQVPKSMVSKLMHSDGCLQHNVFVFKG